MCLPPNTQLKKNICFTIIGLVVILIGYGHQYQGLDAWVSGENSTMSSIQVLSEIIELVSKNSGLGKTAAGPIITGLKMLVRPQLVLILVTISGAIFYVYNYKENPSNVKMPQGFTLTALTFKSGEFYEKLMSTSTNEGAIKNEGEWVVQERAGANSRDVPLKYYMHSRLSYRLDRYGASWYLFSPHSDSYYLVLVANDVTTVDVGKNLKTHKAESGGVLQEQITAEVSSDKQRASYALLNFLVGFSALFVLFTGDGGTGKSWLIGRLVEGEWQKNKFSDFLNALYDETTLPDGVDEIDKVKYLEAMLPDASAKAFVVLFGATDRMRTFYSQRNNSEREFSDEDYENFRTHYVGKVRENFFKQFGGSRADASHLKCVFLTCNSADMSEKLVWFFGGSDEKSRAAARRRMFVNDLEVSIDSLKAHALGEDVDLKSTFALLRQYIFLAPRTTKVASFKLIAYNLTPNALCNYTTTELHYLALGILNFLDINRAEFLSTDLIKHEQMDLARVFEYDPEKDPKKKKKFTGAKKERPMWKGRNGTYNIGGTYSNESEDDV